MITQPELHVRDARPEDTPAMEEVTLAAYAEYETVMPSSVWPGYRESMRAVVADSGPAARIVAEHDGAIVGCVLLYPAGVRVYSYIPGDSRWPEVRFLAVTPAARGLGVGAALMEECVRRAREAGATSLGLHTSDFMRAATHMYTQMGFERDPEADFSPGAGVVVKGYRLEL